MLIFNKYYNSKFILRVLREFFRALIIFTIVTEISIVFNFFRDLIKMKTCTHILPTFP